LFQGFQREAGEPQPGRSHLGLLPDGKVQTANRKQVGARAEVEVEVDTTCDRR
jgi:hypothetical protein